MLWQDQQLPLPSIASLVPLTCLSVDTDPDTPVMCTCELDPTLIIELLPPLPSPSR